MSGLAGKRVLITRPVGQPRDDLRDQLVAHEAVAISFPTIAILPDPEQVTRLDEALRRLPEYDWLIFTSQNAVTLFWERFTRLYSTPDVLRGVKIAAIGPATARVLGEYGLSVALMPAEYVGEAIAHAMGAIRGQKVLLPRAQAAREALLTELTSQGAIVDEIPLYQTVTNRPAPEAWQELEQGVDYITFTSASTVTGFFTLLGERANAVLDRAVVACIGPVTAGALAAYGVNAQIVADDYTAEGLVQAMLTYAEQEEREGNP